MQRHWEQTLHAEECLTISGDDIPVGESAFVISVRFIAKPTLFAGMTMTDVLEPPCVLGLLPRPSIGEPERDVG